MQVGPGPAVLGRRKTTSNRAWCGRSKDAWVRSQHRDAEILAKGGGGSVAGAEQCHGGEPSKRAIRSSVGVSAAWPGLNCRLASRTAKMLHPDAGDSAREGEVLAGDAGRGVARV